MSGVLVSYTRVGWLKSASEAMARVVGRAAGSAAGDAAPDVVQAA